ncbi:MAG: hypothetical protein JNJ40_15205 [Bacteroidia bacterium]|nr:hypothetical protein [Bacteroidia bacterium]
MKIKGQIDEVIKLQVESISKRLKGSVSSIDIINWLGNFHEKDHLKALIVLSKLEYISEHELVELLNERLENIITSTPADHNFIIHPSGEYGKSGTLMIYYLKKTPCYVTNADRIQFYETYKFFKNEKKQFRIKPKSVLIILDDFLGSGYSLLSYYKTYVAPQVLAIPNIVKQYVLSIFHLRRAESLFKKTYGSKLLLVSAEKYPAFSYKKSIFGYREKMLPIREFAHEYGKNLFSLPNRETGKEDIFPLGYENSQALIVFPYNPPNNTLPIIWSNKANWNPLYPRSQQIKINKSKAFRKDLAHNLGLLRHSEVADALYSGSRDLGWKSFNFITKTDFALFAILNLLKKKRPIPLICQELGITENDFNEIILSGINKGIFNADNSITEYGEDIYFDAVKKLKYLKRDNIKELEFKNYKIDYVPKTFNGRS